MIDRGTWQWWWLEARQGEPGAAFHNGREGCVSFWSLTTMGAGNGKKRRLQGLEMGREGGQDTLRFDVCFFFFPFSSLPPVSSEVVAEGGDGEEDLDEGDEM